MLTGRSARHAASPPGLPEPDRSPEPGRSAARRARYLVGALVAVLALVGGGLYLHGRPAASPSRSAAAATGAAATGAAASPTPDTCGSGPAGSCAEGPINVSIARVPHTPAASRSGRPAASPASPRPGTSSASPSGSAGAPPASQQGTPAEQVLALINQARSAAGLAPLTVTDGLISSEARSVLAEYVGDLQVVRVAVDRGQNGS